MKIIQVIIHFITSITLPSGMIGGLIFMYEGLPYAEVILGIGLISAPIWVANVKSLRSQDDRISL
ncbi:hypothetical protein LCGC14_0586550 [marine sediment metagenome]|uniref:Uncharacterized protein n=1 Tax=marine sediment metagenome TaxID=412755 RepID=A0A0F9RJX4_9ZZZZ